MMTEEETTATSESIDWPASFEMQKNRAEKAERALVEVQRMATERADERDTYAAVVAEALAYIDGSWLAPFRPGETGHDIRERLTVVPAEALAARDRRVAAEALREAVDRIGQCTASPGPGQAWIELGLEVAADTVSDYADSIKNGGTP